MMGLGAIIRLGRPSRKLIGIALACILVELAASLAFPVLTRELIDGLNGSGSFSAVTGGRAFRVLVAALLVGALAGAASKYALSAAGLRVVANLKRLLVRRLIWLPVGYFDRHETGSHISRVTNDAHTVARFLTEGMLNAVSGVVLLLGSAIVLVILDAKLSALLFGIILSAFLLIGPVAYRMSRIGFELNEATARLSAALARSFSEIRLVKAFSAEATENERHDREIEQLYKSGLAGAGVQAALTPIISVALSTSLITIFFYGGARVQAGTLSVGTLTAFILYIFNVAAPLIQLSAFATQFQASRGATQRIGQILSESVEAAERPAAAIQARDPAAFRSAQPDLRFEGVEFGYAGALREPLNLDGLTFEGGTSTALVGPSGGGKTTILALILRFYIPERGIIRYGSEDLADIPLDLWRARIAYVPQTSPLLFGSIRDNILYGLAGEVSQEQLEDAAEMAGCMEFIRRLPNGFETAVGESGVLLSGGQRQRVAIARAFIRNPEILLLDEPSSSLDAESEGLVKAAIFRLMNRRTTIIISHRPALMVGVDRVIRIKNGRAEPVQPAFGALPDAIAADG